MKSESPNARHRSLCPFLFPMIRTLGLLLSSTHMTFTESALAQANLEPGKLSAAATGVDHFIQRTRTKLGRKKNRSQLNMTPIDGERTKEIQPGTGPSGHLSRSSGAWPVKIPYRALRFKRSQLEQILVQAPDEIDIPLQLRRSKSGGKARNMEKFTIIAALDEASLNTPKVFDEEGRQLKIEGSVHYQGYLVDSANQSLPSAVDLTFSRTEGNPYVHGVISVGGQTLELTYFKNSSGKREVPLDPSVSSGPSTPSLTSSLVEAALVEADAIHEKRKLCDMQEANLSLNVPSSQTVSWGAPPVESPEAMSAPNPTNPGGKGPIKVDLWADYKTYQDNGSNAQQTTNFLVGVMNAVSAQFALDGLNVQLGKLTIYTSPDPYAAYTLSSEYLVNFATNVANAGSSPNHLAHLVSTLPKQLGGLAYIGGLCTNAKFGFSNFFNSFSNNLGTYSWTINILAHEIGHNLGSRHTHWCGWNVNGSLTRLDKCAAGEWVSGAVGCDSSTAMNMNGTIMSYCHTNGMINPLLGFGQYPLAMIKNYIASATCVAPAGGPDQSPPQVSVVSPKFNTTIATGTRTVLVTATDDRGIQSVEFFFDGKLAGSVSTSPYQFDVPIPQGSLGKQVIRVTATDTSGKKASVELPVTVINDTTPPEIYIDNTKDPYAYSVYENSVLSGSKDYNCSVHFGDNVGIKSATVTLDGTTVMFNSVNSNSTSLFANVKIIPNKLANGPHWFEVKAEDYSGNQSTGKRNFSVSGSIPPSPDTTAPSVSISSPANGFSTSANSVTISANASDNAGGSGVARVEFLRNGILVSSDTSTPYSASIDITSVAAGQSASFAVRAVDAAGNISSLASITGNKISVNTTDTTPPRVEPVSHQNGDFVPVFRPVEITVEASDLASSIGKMQFFFNGSQTATCTLSQSQLTALGGGRVSGSCPVMFGSRKSGIPVQVSVWDTAPTPNSTTLNLNLNSN
jgi:hypothetical protein